MGFDYVNEVTIAMEGKGMEAATAKPKEAPVWMKESTIEGGTKSELSVPVSENVVLYICVVCVSFLFYLISASRSLKWQWLSEFP